MCLCIVLFYFSLLFFLLSFVFRLSVCCMLWLPYGVINDDDDDDDDDDNMVPGCGLPCTPVGRLGTRCAPRPQPVQMIAE